MSKVGLSKGEQSRLQLINSSREIFNEFGLDLRIKDLADKMGVKPSKITNHFPTKSLLIQAIAEEYEEKVTQKISQLINPHDVELVSLVRMSSCLMDLQLEYVCAIMFVLTNNMFTPEDHQKVKDSYLNRRQTIQYFISQLVAKGVLKQEILETKNFERFIHSFFIISIHWLNNYLTYDFDKKFSEIKPMYLRSTYEICLPFLTEKGLADFQSIKFEAACCDLI